MNKKSVVMLLSAFFCILFCCCGNRHTAQPEHVLSVEEQYEENAGNSAIESEVRQESPKEEENISETDIIIGEIPEEVLSKNQKSQEQDNHKYLIVIDPGHQRQGSSIQEPIGPGASETKSRVTDGTSGVQSGLEEYELNLMVSEKLQQELERRGYEVIMTRTEHDVDISNMERAQIANEAHADAFIRIHADGSEDSSIHGMMTICQTSANPYNAHLYSNSKELATDILDCMVTETDAKKNKVWETDSMSGINWATVPCTIIEMGYMSNPQEDMKLADEEYQKQIVVGIANGIDRYFGL